MRLDAAPTPRQICACFPRMLLGLDYLKPRAADEGKVVKASCKSWITYRDAQRAKSPADKPEFEPLPPDTDEAQWRKWLAWPKALPNLKLNEDELWMAVGYLQLKNKNGRKTAQGRPPQSRIDHSGANATCKPCRDDAQSEKGRENNEKAIKNRTADQLVSGQLCKACGNRKADGKKTNAKAREPCAACAAKRAAKAAAAAGAGAAARSS